jgi:hypothetical protein
MAFMAGPFVVLFCVMLTFYVVRPIPSMASQKIFGLCWYPLSGGNQGGGAIENDGL